ncbi:Uncharacterised protein [Yersinia rohdei]|nr:Uncharacterised protein [Yersinia rohdei]
MTASLPDADFLHQLAASTATRTTPFWVRSLAAQVNL